MDLSFYRKLPDYLSVKEIKSHFCELFNYIELNYAASPLSISEALKELAERQSNTFEYVEDGLKQLIDNWVICNWDIDNYKLIDNLLSLIALLGLQKSFDKAKASLTNINLNIDLRKEIESTIKELKGTSVTHFQV
ncbi:hypothetical protein PH210_25405 [Paenibacillus sp. BSR1-1]|uniref:hypothetical protein n=1 Tax=Paenibacillus sp. BSR1-1 TaxID=3020845 RepID=UPI0025B27DB5|nr:hypothetical protein [Paenibacillus sp. BSR1-1]MDN3019505.1 hypothetical protein [Paenibacillus sp. BSR1-1]